MRDVERSEEHDYPNPRHEIKVRDKERGNKNNSISKTGKQSTEGVNVNGIRG